MKGVARAARRLYEREGISPVTVLVVVLNLVLVPGLFIAAMPGDEYRASARAWALAMLAVVAFACVVWILLAFLRRRAVPAAGPLFVAGAGALLWFWAEVVQGLEREAEGATFPSLPGALGLAGCAIGLLLFVWACLRAPRGVEGA